MLLIYLECLVGDVSQLLAIHFSPLMTSHPPCNVRRSTDPRRPLSGSIKLLYHMTAVPFFGVRIRLAEWQFMLRLISSVLSISLKYKKRNNKVVLCSLRPFHIGLLFGKRLGTIFLGNRIQKYPNSPSTRYRICSGLLAFPCEEGIYSLTTKN